MSDLAHYTKRMLQALDAYWSVCEGGHGLGSFRSFERAETADERLWGRFERYRAKVEALIRDGAA